MLDEDDRSRANSVRDDFSKENLNQIGQDLLGRAVASNLSLGKSPFLLSENVVEITSVAPMLYFYPTLTVLLDPHHTSPKTIEDIRPLLERKLVSIFITCHFSCGSEEFQKLASDFPEFFVGHYSFMTYEFYRFNSNLGQDHGGHYLSDMGSRVKQFEKKVDELPIQAGLKASMKHASWFVGHIRAPESLKLLPMLDKLIANPSETEVSEVHNSFKLAFQLKASEALNSVPQISIQPDAASSVSPSAEAAGLLASSLRISHPEIPLPDYLDLIGNKRGILSPDFLRKESIIQKVRDINEDVFKIEESKQLPVGIFLSSIVRTVPSLLARYVSHGIVNSGAMRIPGSIKSSKASLVKARILATYFGVSVPAIHVWELRKSIKRREQDGNSPSLSLPDTSETERIPEAHNHNHVRDERRV